MSNYELQQYFLNIVKQFAISNPERQIDRTFTYSLLEQFNIMDYQKPFMDVSDNFEYWKDRYKNNENIITFEKLNKPFLGFKNGKINGNEVKLYIPLDSDHIKEGVTQIFDFLSNSNIAHESKVSKIIRTDNVVVRVTNLEDADVVINYVLNNSYLKEGLLKVNPFLPNYNGIGVTMDNFTTYNGTVAQIISDYLNYCKANNNMEQFNIEGLNNYIKNCIPNIDDLDVKDIYSLLSNVTKPSFKFDDFVNYARNKIPDKYKEKTRITDPKFYFEEAIFITNGIHPQNTKEAIKAYLKGDATYFSNKQQARKGLLKYVHPGDVINIMRSKLNENGVKIPNTDNELIDEYLNISLSKIQKDVFNILKSSYIDTAKKYGVKQSRVALSRLLEARETKLFTNDNNSRNNIEGILKYDIKRAILQNINIENLNINNNSEIVNRFENIIKPQINSVQKV